jgi:small subunit ribosomal protein S17
MSEEETNETEEEKVEAPEEAPEETPEQEEAPEAEAPAAADDADDGDPAGGDGPAAESGGGGGADAADGAGDEEGISWKDRKRLVKSRQPVEARPQRSPEERQEERNAKRATLAKARRARRTKARAKKSAGNGGTPPAERTRTGQPKERQGTVVSDKADKTITVRIDTARRHPVYEKIVRQTHKIHAHDERNEASEGDVVRVIETRKLSRTKHWRLIEIVEKAR